MDGTYTFLVYSILLISLVSNGASQQLQNPGFETTTYTDWFCTGRCTLTPNEDAFEGTRSVCVSNRGQKCNSAAQNVELVCGIRYRIEAYVKFVTTAVNEVPQEMVAMLTCKNADGDPKYYVFGSSSAGTDQWTKVEGVVRVPSGSTRCKMYFLTAIPAVYLLDATSLTALTTLQNPGFETTTYRDWFCADGCTLNSNEDAFEGSYSVCVNQLWSGAAHYVDLEAGSLYRMAAYVKFVTTKDNQTSQEIILMLTCKDAQEVLRYYEVGSASACTDGWSKVEGSIRVLSDK